MEYKVIPFDPGVVKEGPSVYAANQLRQIIDRASSEGWEFVEVSNYSTIVPGSDGCFGVGATSPYPKTVSMIVFRK